MVTAEAPLLDCSLPEDDDEPDDPDPDASPAEDEPDEPDPLEPDSVPLEELEPAADSVAVEVPELLEDDPPLEPEVGALVDVEVFLEDRAGSCPEASCT